MIGIIGFGLGKIDESIALAAGKLFALNYKYCAVSLHSNYLGKINILYGE